MTTPFSSPSRPDVCKALDIVNVPHAVSALDDDEKMTIANDDSHSGQRGGAQSLNIISEPGLYKLVMRSRKPEAKRFGRNRRTTDRKLWGASPKFLLPARHR